MKFKNKNNLTRFEFGLGYDWRRRWDTRTLTLPSPCPSQKVGHMTGEPMGSHPILQNKNSTRLGAVRVLAEKMGFEPMCRVFGKTISSRSRYDHFDTSP